MRPKIPTPLPCPFCGTTLLEGSLFAHKVCANVPYRYPHEVKDPWESTLSINTNGSGYYYVSCTGPRGVVTCCEGPTIKGPVDSYSANPDKIAKACAAAVEAWNKRVGGQMRMEL